MPTKILLSSFLFALPFMANNSYALKWMPNWFTCTQDSDCTYVDHPCHYIAVNKEGVAGANKIIAFDAPYIDCDGDDLGKKRAMHTINTFCNAEKQCTLTTTKDNNKMRQSDTHANGE